MLRISKLSDYALLVLVELHKAPESRLSAQHLAAQTRLELPTVSKVLKLLTASGVLRSTRGVNGGYALSRPARQINVADIIEAVEGPIAMTECGAEPGRCSHESLCGLRGNWRRISAVVREALVSLSLADMAQPLLPDFHLQRAGASA